jgi:hypothetical protein
MDVVGDQKVWEWGAVNAWLRFNLGLDDGLFYPSPWELGEIDTYIKAVRLERTTGVEWGVEWKTSSVNRLLLTHSALLGSSVPVVWSTLFQDQLIRPQSFVQQDAPWVFVSHAYPATDDYLTTFDDFLDPSGLTVPQPATADQEYGEVVAAA